MGVDIEAYRLCIGLHAARANSANCGKKSGNSHAVHETFTLEYEAEFAPPPSNFCTLRCSRSVAAHALRVVVFASLVLLTSVLKPDVTAKNIHDLSDLILLSGTVETNPGLDKAQTESTSGGTAEAAEPTLAALNTWWETRLEEVMTRTQSQIVHMEAELEQMKVWVQTTSDQNTLQLQQVLESHKALQYETECMKTHLNNLHSELQSKSQTIVNEVDRLEGDMRRNAVRLFGVHEDSRESYWSCLQTILRLFRGSVPGIAWSEKDIKGHLYSKSRVVPISANKATWGLKSSSLA